MIHKRASKCDDFTEISRYKETMPSDAPAARASSFDFADYVAKRARRPGASMRLSALRAALSWICTKKESTIVDSSLLS